MIELTKATDASLVRKAWAEALEGNAYRQGRMFLRQATPKGDSFCCFGVLCDLAVKAGVIPEPLVKAPGPDGMSFEKTTFQYGTDSAQNFHLPDSVKEWAGFNTERGQFFTERGQFFTADLEELNDTGKSFKQIAKVITEEREAFE